ncbi:MAG: leucine-rich repeat protein, partial [Muribaculaceae bacterium]|nr:leucine-rich repeat protein [Muribaculaceae bacterium]
RNAYGSISIPQGLEYLGYKAFYNCGRDLTGDIVIPSGLVNSLCIAMGFANGTNITIPEGVKRIEACRVHLNSRLVLPKSLERIEKEAFYTVRFPTPIDLPENLAYIAPKAFLESTLPGRLVIPPLIESIEESCFNFTKLSEVIIGDNVLRIENEAFGRNGELRYMEIGKNVEYLGRNVIEESWNLQTLVCLAKEPPRADDSFTGIYFDKVILEVPVGCVEKYRKAPGWRQFKNITEHRELSFNINEISCLDRGVTRTGIIRSEGPWRVSEKPSWVSISPMSGTAKDELTITVNPQNPGSNQREGKIIFSLDGRNYTATLPISQKSAEYGEDKEIVLQTASAKGNEIPLFIVGEGFTADEIVNGRYMNRMRETMEQFFDIEPYRSLRNHFTVSTSLACSPEKGTSDYAMTVENKFDTYGITPQNNLLRKYVERVSSHAGRNMQNALIIVVVNHPVFSGHSSIEHDGCSIASIGTPDGSYPYDIRGLVQHFAGGEAFAGLGDESVSHFDHIKSCKCPGCNRLQHIVEMKSRGFYDNLSLSSKMGDAPWLDLIFHEKY